jgi:hypothetical protein
MLRLRSHQFYTQYIQRIEPVHQTSQPSVQFLKLLPTWLHEATGWKNNKPFLVIMRFLVIIPDNMVDATHVCCPGI